MSVTLWSNLYRYFTSPKTADVKRILSLEPNWEDAKWLIRWYQSIAARSLNRSPQDPYCEFDEVKLYIIRAFGRVQPGLQELLRMQADKWTDMERAILLDGIVSVAAPTVPNAINALRLASTDVTKQLERFSSVNHIERLVRATYEVATLTPDSLVNLLVASKKCDSLNIMKGLSIAGGLKNERLWVLEQLFASREWRAEFHFLCAVGFIWSEEFIACNPTVDRAAKNGGPKSVQCLKYYRLLFAATAEIDRLREVNQVRIENTDWQDGFTDWEDGFTEFKGQLTAAWDAEINRIHTANNEHARYDADLYASLRSQMGFADADCYYRPSKPEPIPRMRQVYCGSSGHSVLLQRWVAWSYLGSGSQPRSLLQEEWILELDESNLSAIRQCSLEDLDWP